MTRWLFPLWVGLRSRVGGASVRVGPLSTPSLARPSAIAMRHTDPADPPQYWQAGLGRANPSCK
jgi:hypothetical protein